MGLLQFKSNKFLLLAIGVLLFSIIHIYGCGDNSPKPKPPEPTVTLPIAEELYSTPQGTGQYDSMTYYHYESFARFKTDSSILITEITPDVFYCNGTCYFALGIFDDNGMLIASGNSEVSNHYINMPVKFEEPVKLEKNIWYRIYLHTYTTMSVGIHTSGNDSSLCTNVGCLQIVFAHSNIHDYDLTDRGSICFSLSGSFVDTK